MAEHYRNLLELLGDHLATVQMRKHLAWYSKGMNEAAEFRQSINRAQNPDQMWPRINERFDHAQSVAQGKRFVKNNPV